MSGDPIRVAQWATGMVGARSLRYIISRPDLELVGVKVYDPGKVGLDAGALCEQAHTGVRAVSSVDEVIDCRPDCVVHTPLASDGISELQHDLARLLRAGINVVSSSIWEAMHPPSLDPDVRRNLESACDAGGSSLRALGLSPGFAHDVLPLTLASICGNIRHIHMREYVNMAERESKAVCDLLGFGASFDYSLPERFRRGLDASYEAPMRMLAAQLGSTLDDIVVTTEPAIATRAFPIRVTEIEKGTVAGWRFVYEGRREGRPFVTIDTSWHLHDQWGIGPDWPEGEGWDMTIDADPEVRFQWEVGPSGDVKSRSAYRLAANAAHVVNAVPSVVAAAPGIMTLEHLGLASAR